MLDTPFFLRWLTAAATSVGREAARLTDLDSAIGDADHGTNMQRGFAAVTEALEKEPPGSPGAALILAGRQLISKVGGASGPLYGTLLRRAGKALGDAEQITPQQLADDLMRVSLRIRRPWRFAAEATALLVAAVVAFPRG
ncbi:DAK2 domain-containing protein, partial [Streptomyces asiaticus]